MDYHLSVCVLFPFGNADSGADPKTYLSLRWAQTNCEADQYRVKTDKRSGIVNDPNRADDPQYIVRLIGKVISLSLETAQIVEALPELGVSVEEDAVLT